MSRTGDPQSSRRRYMYCTGLKVKRGQGTVVYTLGDETRGRGHLETTISLQSCLAVDRKFLLREGNKRAKVKQIKGT